MEYSTVEQRFDYSVHQLLTVLHLDPSTTGFPPHPHSRPNEPQNFEEYLQSLLNFVSFDLQLFPEQLQRTQIEMNDIVARLPLEMTQLGQDLIQNVNTQDPHHDPFTSTQPHFNNPDLIQIYESVGRIKRMKDIAQFWQQPISEPVSQTFSHLLSYALHPAEKLRRAAFSIWRQFYNALPMLAVQLFRFEQFVIQFITVYITCPIDARYFLYSAPLTTSKEVIRAHIKSTQLFHHIIESPNTNPPAQSQQIRDVFSYVSLLPSDLSTLITDQNTQISNYLALHVSPETTNSPTNQSEIELVGSEWYDRDQRVLTFISRGLELGEFWYDALCNAGVILQHFDEMSQRLYDHRLKQIDQLRQHQLNNIPIQTAAAVPSVSLNKSVSEEQKLQKQVEFMILKVGTAFTTSLSSFLDYKSYYRSDLGKIGRFNLSDYNAVNQQPLLQSPDRQRSAHITPELLATWHHDQKLDPVVEIISTHSIIYKHVIPQHYRYRSYIVRRLIDLCSTLDHLYLLVPLLSEGFIDHDFADNLLLGFFHHPLLLNPITNSILDASIQSPLIHPPSTPATLDSKLLSNPMSSTFKSTIFSSPEFSLIFHIVFNTPIFYKLCDISEHPTYTLKANEIINKVIPALFTLFPFTDFRLAFLYKLGFQLHETGTDEIQSCFASDTLPPQSPPLPTIPLLSPPTSPLPHFNYLATIIPTTIQFALSQSKSSLTSHSHHHDPNPPLFLHNLVQSLYAFQNATVLNTQTHLTPNQPHPASPHPIAADLNDHSDLQTLQTHATTSIMIIKALSPRTTEASTFAFLKSFMNPSQQRTLQEFKQLRDSPSSSTSSGLSPSTSTTTHLNPGGRAIIRMAAPHTQRRTATTTTTTTTTHIEDETPLLVGALEDVLELTILDILSDDSC